MKFWEIVATLLAEGENLPDCYPEELEQAAKKICSQVGIRKNEMDREVSIEILQQGRRLLTMPEDEYQKIKDRALKARNDRN